jgi:4-diphosphocytidyl-2-C-methyl-D-erythritol kinase
MTRSSSTLIGLPAPAKLNLFLHITGRRQDGYHSLETVFQLIDLKDSLDFESTNNGQILLSDNSEILPEKNLVVRAARALQAETKWAGQGVNIRLHKQIPVGGGLGGGSSNAATTLLALNKLWQLELSADRLAAIGLSLGADVPFFLCGHNAWAQGIGEELTPLALPKRWFLLVYPGVSISTQKIFAHPDLTRNTPRAIISDFTRTWKLAGYFGQNDLQTVAARLESAVAIALNSVPNSRMTGSGACVFAAFQSLALAKQAKHRVKLPSKMRAWVVKSLPKHPLHGYGLFK